MKIKETNENTKLKTFKMGYFYRFGVGNAPLYKDVVALIKKELINTITTTSKLWIHSSDNPIMNMKKH